MYWIYPKKKHSDTVFASYDASQPKNFASPDENCGAFTPEECDRIIALSKTAPKLDSNLGDGTVSDRQVDVWSISYTEETKWLWEKLTKNVINTNNSWWDYDIYGIVENLQLFCYDATKVRDGKTDYYDQHVDNQYPFSYRKISFSVELSDPNTYEGAELNIYTREEPIDLPKARGTMVMFPAFFLNEVTPILKGKRWSLVCWVSGPQFR